MGTNFYAKKIPTEAEIIESYHKLDQWLLLGREEEFKNYIEEIAPTIHLGKRSCGWQFHWQCNNDYYSESLESIKKLLSSPRWRIFDEYGEQFTLEKFLDEEIGASLYCTPGKYDNAFSYHYEGPNYCDFGGKYYEFISNDGLRFSREDFS